MWGQNKLLNKFSGDVKKISKELFFFLFLSDKPHNVLLGHSEITAFQYIQIMPTFSDCLLCPSRQEQTLTQVRR